MEPQGRGVYLVMNERPWTAIVERLREAPWEWEGRAAILEMREADFQWRQMEWVGFYFEFLCGRLLEGVLDMPGPSHGNVRFDGFRRYPWDIKAHVLRNARGASNRDIIVNDKAAIDWAIRRYGRVGLIVANGLADFNDDDREFYWWHQELKGGDTVYVKKRPERRAPSRRRKMSLDVQSYEIHVLDDSASACLRIHRQGRNADGSPRRVKYQLRPELASPVARLTRPRGDEP